MVYLDASAIVKRYVVEVVNCRRMGEDQRSDARSVMVGARATADRCVDYRCYCPT